MASDRNKETKDDVRREIKELQARCLHQWKVIDNSPLEAPCESLEEINEKKLCYLEGLGMEIQNSNTPITLDENLLTSQFLKEITDKTAQVEEYTAFIKGSIHDTDAEINRLKTVITITQEAKNRPKTNKLEVKPEHLFRAKEKFKSMKAELHGLIQSLFPNCDHLVFEIMGQLMAENLNETSNGYIPITSETFQIIELLKDMNLVAVNPYNHMEVKLA
nr:uncharacterized protein LOC110372510 [Helicoverpa armigera]